MIWFVLIIGRKHLILRPSVCFAKKCFKHNNQSEIRNASAKTYNPRAKRMEMILEDRFFGFNCWQTHFGAGFTTCFNWALITAEWSLSCLVSALKLVNACRSLLSRAQWFLEFGSNSHANFVCCISESSIGCSAQLPFIDRTWAESFKSGIFFFQIQTRR